MIKTIYILWFQGFDNAPDIIKKCVDSWKYYNSDWNIILLDDNNLCKYLTLDNYLCKNINKIALSDIVRIILLKSYGGLWVDATTFCNKPLNDWISNYIKEGFFAFDKPGPDRLLSSWFIYSEKDNYIIDKWYNSVIIYYNNRDTPHTYFWFHYLFGEIYNKDVIFKNVWDNVPKLSANGIGPHYIHENGLFKNITPKIKKDIDTKITPLYKLTYKRNFPIYNESIIIYYLYSTIKS